MKNNLIKILIVDDHTLFCLGLRKILECEKGLKVAGEAADGLEAVRKAKELSPDVILMDITLPKLDGPAAIRRIKRENPNINVVMLTIHADRNHIFEAFEAGAIGYILKDDEPEKMVKIIRAASRGEPMIQSHIASQLLKEFQQFLKDSQTIKEQEEAEPYSTLSDREKEILKMVALGKTNKEIAAALSINEKTVKTHIYHIFQKLQMNTRTQLALFAYRRGLVK